jgi:hypothetical protein
MASKLSQNRAPRERVNEMVWVDTRGFCARTRQKGKASHRGHGGHRGGLGWVDKCTRVKIVGTRAGTRQRGKHRTEVTEAAEGDWGGWTNALGSRSLAHVREHAKGEKHRTEVTEATEGLGLVDESTWVKIVGSCARNTPKRKASHRGHGGHRGGLGWWTNVLG